MTGLILEFVCRPFSVDGVSRPWVFLNFAVYKLYIYIYMCVFLFGFRSWSVCVPVCVCVCMCPLLLFKGISTGSGMLDANMARCVGVCVCVDEDDEINA
jgi:hypothetical protein